MVASWASFQVLGIKCSLTNFLHDLTALGLFWALLVVAVRAAASEFEISIAERDAFTLGSAVW